MLESYSSALGSKEEHIDENVCRQVKGEEFVWPYYDALHCLSNITAENEKCRIGGGHLRRVENFWKGYHRK